MSDQEEAEPESTVDAVAEEPTEGGVAGKNLASVSLGELQEEKLRAEIRQIEEANRWFSWRISLGQLVPLVIGLGILFVTWKTGLLDAKRLELSAEKSKFQKEVLVAKENADKGKVVLEDLKKQLASYKVKLSTNEVLVALSNKQSKAYRSTVDVDFTAEPPAVTYKCSDESGQYVRDTLEALAVLDKCNIEEIVLDGMRLAQVDMDLLVALSPENLTLKNNHIGMEEAKILGELSTIRSLSLERQDFYDLSWAVDIEQIQFLTLRELELEAGSFNENFAFARGLQTILLFDIPLRDSDLDSIKQFTRLKTLMAPDSVPVSPSKLLDFYESTNCSIAMSLEKFDYASAAELRLVELAKKHKAMKVTNPLEPDARVLLVRAPHPAVHSKARICITEFPNPKLENHPRRELAP